MQNTIDTFEGTTIRRTIINGEPWFVAADVCKAINIKNCSQKCKDIHKDDKTTIYSTESGSNYKHNLIYINESGLYDLILSCRTNKKTTDFRRWITKDVIPSIRKTGSYTIPTKQNELNIKEQWELDKDVVQFFKWEYSQDAIVLSRLKDYMVEKWIPIQNNGDNTNNEQTYLYDLSSIIIRMDLKPYEYNLVKLGKFIAKEYRKQYGTDPSTTEKACNGSYRPCKAYKHKEVPFVIECINLYIEKEKQEKKKQLIDLNTIDKYMQGPKGTPWTTKKKKEED